jgi:hypothetical protein
MAVLKPFVLAVLAVAGLVSCGDDTVGSPETPCTEIFADGATTPNLDDQPECLDGGVVRHVAANSTACADGGLLFYNEFGFGLEGEPWSTKSTTDEGYDSATPLTEAIAACSP